MTEEPQPFPQTGNPLDLDLDLDMESGARLDLGARYERKVVRLVTRFESDRFNVCEPREVRLPPPPMLALFVSERVRLVHRMGDGVWEIVDPFD